MWTSLCLVLSLVLSLVLLVPPTRSFSSGAGHASCQGMIPTHIRAQPLDPRRSPVTLSASASSYLPGQLVTVTVRSSRDFMGFLLQARAVDMALGRTGGRVKARTGAEGTIESMNLGPMLVGGSWTLTPPGTHTLRCLLADDTLTHTDKQLKRNLSFVWKAPDAPMGAIRFYITVVQSYFVYWAGIESTLVLDGSRSPWSGSSRLHSLFLLQEEVTTLADVSIRRTSTQQAMATPGPRTKPRLPTTHKGIKTYTPKGVRHSVLDSFRTVLEDNLKKNQAVNDEDVGTRRSETDTYIPSRSYFGGSTDVGTVSGSSDTHVKDPKNSSETERIKAPVIHLFKVTGRNSTGPVLFGPLPDAGLNGNEGKVNLKDPHPHTGPETKDTTFNHQVTTSGLHFHSTRPAPSTSKTPMGSAQVQTGSFRIQSRRKSPHELQTTVFTEGMEGQSLPPLQSPSHKPFLQVTSSAPRPLSLSHKVLHHTFPSIQDLTSSSNKPPDRHSNSTSSVSQGQPLPIDVFLNQLKVPSNNLSKYGPSETQARQRQTVPPYPQPLFPSSAFFHTGFIQADTPTKARGISPRSWSQPHLQTGPPHNKPAFTQTSSLSEGEDLQTPTTTYTFPSIPASIHSFPDSSLVHPRTTTPPHSRGSNVASNQSSFSTSPSAPTKNQPTFPSPASVPLLPSDQSSRTSPSIPIKNSSDYPAPAPFFSSSPSTISLNLFFSIDLSSSLSHPLSSISTSTSSFSSSVASSQPTSNRLEPSAVPRRSLFSRLTSTPGRSQPLTVGQRLLIQDHIASPDPDPNLIPTPRTVVHANAVKPKIPIINTGPKHPSSPSGTPDREGKYPNIIPRHTSWELGMLLGCSAGLGMFLVVGVRYMYRQTCGRRTEVTLSDREQEYGRERGLIHVQECGDLVRVRRIRDNSVVLLAEYDILASPGD
ncbi:mucin-2-like [Antennarius striatus]|uniref:mucin-2-like n=1 Tax=Antennarius striatus TaxID=241820 RepID=UPI0035B2FE2C